MVNHLAMNVTVRPDLGRLIERKLVIGRYAARDAGIGEALELTRQQDDVLVELQDALGEAHRRNAYLDLEAAETLIEVTVGKDRLQHR